MKQPELNRLIKCTASDWSTYTCVGEFRQVRNGKKKQNRFFLKKPDGTFESARSIWDEVETWEYVEEMEK